MLRYGHTHNRRSPFGRRASNEAVSRPGSVFSKVDDGMLVSSTNRTARHNSPKRLLGRPFPPFFSFSSKVDEASRSVSSTISRFPETASQTVHFHPNAMGRQSRKTYSTRETRPARHLARVTRGISRLHALEKRLC